MKRVIGVGGIFFKAKNPKLLREWYKKHLGLNTDEYGCLFSLTSEKDNLDKAFVQWSPFEENTTYFLPSEKEFMINFRVENLTKLVEVLKNEGIEFLDEIETFDYGKFIHLMDLEGNKIELWEPSEQAF